MQARLDRELGHPTFANELPKILGRVVGPETGITWRGGYLNLDDKHATFAWINGHGPWIAVVEGIGRDHAVVVDGLDADGYVSVRDPWGVGRGTAYVRDPHGRGSSYKVPLNEFMDHWQGGIWGEKDDSGRTSD